MQFGTSLVVQWLGLHLPMKGVHFLPLVWEAGIPHALRWKNQKMKQEQYCNIFNKDLKIYATQCKKKIQYKNRQKICPDIFFPKEAIQMASRYAKMVLNITNHQGTANPNHNKLSPHICQNGCYQKDKK